MYNENQMRHIEGLVLDFLVFRKHKQEATAMASVEFKPERDNYTEWSSNSLVENETLDQDSYFSQEDYDTQNFVDDTVGALEVADMETDLMFIRQLFGEINKKLYSYVIEVVNENEYEGSPIYDEQISREYLAQLVDQVIERAARGINEVEEIHLELETERTYWGRNKLLRSVVESSVLHELHGYRRPKYRRFNRYYRNHNNGSDKNHRHDNHHEHDRNHGHDNHHGHDKNHGHDNHHGHDKNHGHNNHHGHDKNHGHNNHHGYHRYGKGKGHGSSPSVGNGQKY